MGTMKKMIVATAGVAAVSYVVYKHRISIMDFLRKYIRKDEPAKTPDFPSADFVANASRFSGIYEALYKTLRDVEPKSEDIDRIHQDVDLRFKSLNSESLVTYWKTTSALSKVEQLRVFLQDVVSSGMKRDDRTEFTVGDGSEKNYIEWTGTELASGDHVKVGSPAWTLNGVCVEKGMVTKYNI